MSDQTADDKPIAYEAYQRLAERYAALIDTKPHNAYYERPAMLSMWPDLSGKRVLDAGCGPGVYAEELSKRGAKATSIDVSEKMIDCAKERLGPTADVRVVDMRKPLTMFEDNEFDFVNAPLCLDYIKDWRPLFSEFRRILRREGRLQFSCAHPAHDAEYFGTEEYAKTEQVSATWTGFGIPVNVAAYRRSLQEILMPLIETGFVIQKVLEPLPTEEFKKADRRRYDILIRRPSFLCIQSQLA